MKHQEHIVAVPNSIFNERANGFCRVDIENSDIFIAQRAVLETDDDFRQIIPINVMICRGKIWAYRREVQGGEARLHGKVSVSVGGHWDIDDLVTKSSVIDLAASMERAAKREVEEEVRIQTPVLSVSRMSDMLVADDTSVDRVHAAMIFFHALSDRMVTPKEYQLTGLGWYTPEELLNSDMELETWTTKICELIIVNTELVA